VFWAEVTFHCSGTGGSTETPLTGTAGEKVRIILDRAMEFRQTQKDKLESDPTLTTGDVTSLNLTMMKVTEATGPRNN
jgi:aminoacylase